MEDEEYHQPNPSQKSKKWRRKKKKRAAAAVALVRGTHVKQCVEGMVIDVMAALVASEHVHTIVRKHLKRMEGFPSATGINHTHNTVTAAIFGNTLLSYPETSKSSKKTKKQGLGVSADGENNMQGGGNAVAGEEMSTMQSLRQSFMTIARLSKTERSTALKLRHLLHERVLRLCAVRQIHMEHVCQGLPVDAGRLSRLVHLHTTTTTAGTAITGGTATGTTGTANGAGAGGADHNQRMHLDWRHRLLIAFTPCDDWTWLLKEGVDVKDHRDTSRSHPHSHATNKHTPLSQTQHQGQSHTQHPTQHPTQPAAISHAVYSMDIEAIKKKRPHRVIQEIESAAGRVVGTIGSQKMTGQKR